MLSTEPGMQYADTVVLMVVEVGTMMTKKLQWKKPGIIKVIELAQGHGQS